MATIMAALAALSVTKVDGFGEASAEVRPGVGEEGRAATAKVTQAALLLKTVIRGCNFLRPTTLSSYGHCILTVLQHLSSWPPSQKDAATEIMSVFEWRVYSLAVLGSPDLDTGLSPLDSDDTDTRSMTNLLGLCATLLCTRGCCQAAAALADLFLDLHVQASKRIQHTEPFRSPTRT